MNAFLISTLLCICFGFFQAASQAVNPVFPFTSVKLLGEDIFFTLDKKRSEWHRLLSIDNIGADVFIRKAKDHFGELSCDYELPCFKFNLIVNFEKVYEIVAGQKIKHPVSVEYKENDVRHQTGIDVEANEEKYNAYKAAKEQNINDSKTTIFQKSQSGFDIGSKSGNVIFKNLRNPTNDISNLLEKYSKDPMNGFIKESDKILSSNNQVQSELDTMKGEIAKIEIEEHVIEKNLLNNMKNLTSNLEGEKSLIVGLYKREIIAGIIGGIFVSMCVISFYFFNGISINSSKSHRDLKDLKARKC